MSVYFPYKIFAGSDIIAYSFELPHSLAAVFTEGDRVADHVVPGECRAARLRQTLIFGKTKLVGTN